MPTPTTLKGLTWAWAVPPVPASTAPRASTGPSHLLWSPIVIGRKVACFISPSPFLIGGFPWQWAYRQHCPFHGMLHTTNQQKATTWEERAGGRSTTTSPDAQAERQGKMCERTNTGKLPWTLVSRAGTPL